MYIKQFYDVKKRTQTEQVLKNQEDIDALKDKDTDIEQSIDDEANARVQADASLRNDMNTNATNIANNTTQITALQAGKQDKLTAGTNITIDENNVISASGGISSVKAENVDSESATSGQVLTANGSGGASWQNASGEKLYRHNIKAFFKILTAGIGVVNVGVSIITKSQTAMTKNDFARYLHNNGYTDSYYGLSASCGALGDNLNSNAFCVGTKLFGNNNGDLGFTFLFVNIDFTNQSISSSVHQTTGNSIIDTVIEL